MIKLIIFDLDGVLVKTKQLHYDALNEALGADYAISWEEHINKYDGLKTRQKLDMLSETKGLPVAEHDNIWRKKQELTIKKLGDFEESKELTECFEYFSGEGYKIACCSNSIRKTIFTILYKLKIIQHFDLIISNEDVEFSKPHPQMYWDAMTKLGYPPEETIIIEDSPTGLLAAHRSGAHVMRVTSPKEVKIKNILNNLKMANHEEIPKWKDKKMNVLIPMAGAGRRFMEAGYTFPKPLIEVHGKPMIHLVVDNLNIDANYIFIVQKEHKEKYNLDALLKLIVPDCTVIDVDGITEGAACTTLLAKEFIDNDNPLLFANSDQFVGWNSNDFMYKMTESECDGGILTFEATHPKWSFVKLNDMGLVTELAEKKPISDIATVGIYYWKSGSDYVKYAEQMIDKNIRVNNEFYVVGLQRSH